MGQLDLTYAWQVLRNQPLDLSINRKRRSPNDHKKRKPAYDGNLGYGFADHDVPWRTKDLNAPEDEIVASAPNLPGPGGSFPIGKMKAGSSK